MAACAFLQGLAISELSNKELLDVQGNDYQLVLGIREVK